MIKAFEDKPALFVQNVNHVFRPFLFLDLLKRLPALLSEESCDVDGKRQRTRILFCHLYCFRRVKPQLLCGDMTIIVFCNVEALFWLVSHKFLVIINAPRNLVLLLDSFLLISRKSGSRLINHRHIRSLSRLVVEINLALFLMIIERIFEVF
jgi:hypothetical protein